MKRFRVRFIKEDAITQPATKPADVSFDETQQQIENTEEEKQENALLANGGLQPQDVDGMTDGAVLGTMLSPNQEIQDDTLQALGKKATDFVNKVSTNTITPQEKKDIGNEVVANFKTAQQTGFAESILWNDFETKILKSLNENLDEFDFSADIAQDRQNKKNPPPSFGSFSITLGMEVANQLCNKFKLGADKETKVQNWVTRWMNNNTEIIRVLYRNCNGRETEKEVQEVIKTLQRDFISDFS